MHRTDPRPTAAIGAGRTLPSRCGRAFFLGVTAGTKPGERRDAAGMHPNLFILRSPVPRDYSGTTRALNCRRFPTGATSLLMTALHRGLLTLAEFPRRSHRRMARRSRGRFCGTPYLKSSCAAQLLTDVSACDNCGYAILRSRSTQHTSHRPQQPGSTFTAQCRPARLSALTPKGAPTGPFLGTGLFSRPPASDFKRSARHAVKLWSFSRGELGAQVVAMPSLT